MAKKAKRSTVKLTRWDSAEHLKTEADIAAYLNAALEEGAEDPAFLGYALGVVARARNISQLARDTEMSREVLYRAFSGEVSPSFGTIQKIARALGVTISFRPLG